MHVDLAHVIGAKVSILLGGKIVGRACIVGYLSAECGVGGGIGSGIGTGSASTQVGRVWTGATRGKAYCETHDCGNFVQHIALRKLNWGLASIEAESRYATYALGFPQIG